MVVFFERTALAPIDRRPNSRLDRSCEEYLIAKAAMIPCHDLCVFKIYVMTVILGGGRGEYAIYPQ